MIMPGDGPLLPGVQIALDLDTVVPLLNRALREHGEELEAMKQSLSQAKIASLCSQ